MNELIYEIEKIARKAGEIMLEAKNEKNKGIEMKEGVGNIVTKYDKLVQEYIEAELKKLLPESHFIGEEEDMQEDVLQRGYTFIVDPIDGTANFARNLNLSSVSIGLLKDGEQYMAACYNPYREEMFLAERGQGAYMNGERIHVSKKKLDQAVFSAGSGPYYAELREKTINMFATYFRLANDYRRIGSAVIEICDVAAGRIEFYCEERLQIWDYAACTLILKEAGGKTTDFEGRPLNFRGPSSVMASNDAEDYLSYLHEESL